MVKRFNSMEEYYFADLSGYYKNIQMGLPALYYEGRNDPPSLSPWIEYFCRIMAYAFQQVAISAQKNSKSLLHPIISKLEPKEVVLLRMLLQNDGQIKPKDIANTFQVTNRTADNLRLRGGFAVFAEIAISPI